MSQTNTDKPKWIRLEPGIRSRQHPTRKHGSVKPDVYFVLRFTVDGKTRQEALGWASEGMTLAKVRIELARLKEAKRTGEGARSLRERREEEAQKRIELEAKMREQEVALLTLAEYWDTAYWPAQAHKARGSLDAEAALWSKWIKPEIGHIRFTALTPEDIERIKSIMLKAGRSPSSIKYAFAVISQLWNLAKRNQVITTECPCKHVSLPKLDNKRQRYLSRSEAQKLLNKLQDSYQSIYGMAVFGLECGLRFGEIAALRWEDCNFERGIILIRDPKARVNRYAFMTKRVREVLAQIGRQPSGIIFPDKNGNVRDRIPKLFRHFADEMFNQNTADPRLRVCFHTLRHTFASWLVEGGRSLYEVKELMDHAYFSMTQRYAHLSPDGLKEAIKIIEKNNNG
ncbi:MAG: site-specific integrase [Desulfovibrio sp.]|nr:site-specific integrase [Desulfovibrio sp.]